MSINEFSFFNQDEPMDYFDYSEQNIDNESSKQVIIIDDDNIIEDDSSVEYIVEKVLDHRFVKKVNFINEFFVSVNMINFCVLVIYRMLYKILGKVTIPVEMGELALRI